MTGTDFVAGSGTMTFLPGQTSKTVELTVNGDTTFEPNETLRVALSNPANATIGAPGFGVVTILNDDAPAAGFRITTASLPNGHLGNELRDDPRRVGRHRGLQVEASLTEASHGPQAEREDRRDLRDPQEADRDVPPSPSRPGTRRRRFGNPRSNTSRRRPSPSW